MTDDVSRRPKSRKLWLAVAFLIAAAVVAFKLTFATYSYRYRLDISLSVDGEPHTGSGVIEVIFRCGPPISGFGRCAHSVQGQAPVIDLGSRGVIVAALYTGDTVHSAPDNAIDAVWLGAYAFGNRCADEELSKLSTLRGKRSITGGSLPRLIWFSDRSSPASATRITNENASQVLGSLVAFSDISVEITADPIHISIDKALSWIPSLERKERSGLNITEFGKPYLLAKMFVGDR